jgi:hypothetical protein
MKFIDDSHQITLDSDFETGSAGPVRLVEGVYEIAPQPEPVSPWFTAALEENFGGAGVPREYACHVRVTSSAAAGQRIRLRFLFSETNGKGYMDPPYWILRDKRWWPIDDRATRFVSEEHVELDIDVPARGAVHVANKPYVSGGDVASELEALAQVGPFEVEQIGLTAKDRPLLSLSSTRADGTRAEDTILIGATMQPAEPAARPVMAVAHALNDGSALSKRLLERFRFVLIPLPNPDGTAEGRSCTNGCGQVPMFSFGRLLAGEDDVPNETAALWQHAEALRPAAYIEFHTHYQVSRSHKLNPMGADWFDVERHAELERVNGALLSTNLDWRVTPIERTTPLCEAGKFTNLADRFGTLAYCYQIYCISEEATAWHAATVSMTLARALAGAEWAAEAPSPSIVPG